MFWLVWIGPLLGDICSKNRYHEYWQVVDKVNVLLTCGWAGYCAGKTQSCKSPVCEQCNNQWYDCDCFFDDRLSFAIAPRACACQSTEQDFYGTTKE